MNCILGCWEFSQELKRKRVFIPWGQMTKMSIYPNQIKGLGWLSDRSGKWIISKSPIKTHATEGAHLDPILSPFAWR